VTDAPGTAFLTSKCVEAIEIVLSVFERRRERFKRLFELMNELKNIVTAQEQLKKLEDVKLISEPVFHHGFRYKTAVIIPEIRACVAALACDSALPETYNRWNFCLTRHAASSSTTRDTAQPDYENDLPHAKYEINFKTAKKFLLEVVSSFQQTLRDEVELPKQSESKDVGKRVSQEHKNTIASTEAAVKDGEKILEIIRTIHQEIKNPKPVPEGDVSKKTRNEAWSKDLRALPKWICSKDYWAATKRALHLYDNPDEDLDKRRGLSKAMLNTLEMHWARHEEAAGNALKTVEAFADYLKTILEDFERMAGNLTLKPEEAVDTFLNVSETATKNIVALRKQLSNDLDIGVRWAEVVMNRHLAYAASGAMAQFDPSELAHAVRVMSRDSGRVRFALILKALQVVCASQRTDGTWCCQQPFYWTNSGFALWTMSLETASAVVSTVRMLVANPDRYGAGLAEVTAGLEPVYTSLDRFFRWLSGSLQSFQAPPELIDAAKLAHPKDEKNPTASGTTVEKNDASGAAAVTKTSEEPPLYGWCSDRLSESECIHSWATAIAIEFLVDFRRLMQERINAALRAEFLSHHPSELTRLSEVAPTDLRNVLKRDDQGPVIAWLMKLLREHKKLELAEGPWVPSKPDEAKISFWSGLLYGPPGTSKTHLAKAIAGELGWPLISVSPSDFLAKGDAHIEPRAQEIFSSFSAASRIVFFFDEIDELIRDRSQHKDQRSALSFLTPSFLTKLQDFRDAAARNEFIFILATNYKDRIDSAAIRSGRIDQSLPLVYPDSPSRANIIIRALLHKSKEKALEKQFQHVAEYLQNVQERLKALKLKGDSGKFLDGLAEFTGFLSYQKISALLRLLPRDNFSTDGEKLERKEELETLIKELALVGKKEGGRYQPEISLAEYAERPDTFSDELKLLMEVIPQAKFPWASTESPGGPLLQEQLVDLHGKIGLKEQFEKFKNDVGELRKKKFPSAPPLKKPATMNRIIPEVRRPK
jgi:SpoVK/Ycf46/Vps4 family AAA+-type ATPase